MNCLDAKRSTTATNTGTRGGFTHAAQQRLQNFTRLNQPLSHAPSADAEIELLHAGNCSISQHSEEHL
jgi:hypothetical protein